MWGQRIGLRGKVKNRGPETYECNMTPLLERHFHVTLIALVTFQVAIIIAHGKVHFVRVSSFNEGGGTDGSDVGVVEGDDALGGAASEVG
jgi:hypothetical protein